MQVATFLARVLATTALASQLGAWHFVSQANAESAALSVAGAQSDGAQAPTAPGEPPRKRRDRRTGVDFNPKFNIRAPSPRPRRADPDTPFGRPNAVGGQAPAALAAGAAAAATPTAVTLGRPGSAPDDPSVTAAPSPPEAAPDKGATAGDANTAAIGATTAPGLTTPGLTEAESARAASATPRLGKPIPLRSPRRPAPPVAVPQQPEPNAEAAVASVPTEPATASLNRTAHRPVRHPHRSPGPAPAMAQLQSDGATSDAGAPVTPPSASADGSAADGEVATAPAVIASANGAGPIEATAPVLSVASHGGEAAGSGAAATPETEPSAAVTAAPAAAEDADDGAADAPISTEMAAATDHAADDDATAIAGAAEGGDHPPDGDDNHEEEDQRDDGHGEETASDAAAAIGAHDTDTGNGAATPDAEGEAEWDTPDTDPLPPGPRPLQLTRMLTALQDDIALGSSDALAAQRVLSRRIAERFRASTRKEWRDPRNARALAVYALSGGDPAVVRDVLKKTRLKQPYEALVAGALAYLEGRAKDANRHFGLIQAESLDASVRGSMHLAQAALAIADNPAAASAFLDEARLAAPGTLVEEAALRRSILIAAEKNELPTFERMVERYLRKFRGSVYAGNFRERLAAALTRMTFINDPQSFTRLDEMLAPMTEAGRQELYLQVARAAVENGNHVAAQLAGRRVQATAEPGSLDHRRARLYQAAADVVDAPLSTAAVATLTTLSGEALPAADRALLDAALSLSRTVMDLPPAQRSAAADPDILSLDAAPPGGLTSAPDAPRRDPDGTTAGAPAAPATTAGAVSAADDVTDAATAAGPTITPDVGIDAGPFAPPLAMERRVEAAVAAVDALLEEEN